METQEEDVDVMDALLTCALVARMANVTPETVRAWERRGVLPARRTASGIRLFKPADVEALIRHRELVHQGKRMPGS
jgi:DNA-binding transcriptional MerR regulator